MLNKVTSFYKLYVPIDLDLLMTYSSDVPSCFGTPDGFHHLCDGYIAEVPTDKIYHIVDGNEMFYTMTNIPDTFEDIGLQLLQSQKNKKFLIFSTDNYVEGSTRSSELRRRAGMAEPQVLVLSGEKMRRPEDFKLFLQCPENKIAFSKLLLKNWSSEKAAPLIKDQHVCLIVKGKFYKLNSTDGSAVTATEIEEFFSNQEESDTRMVLYLQYIWNLDEKAIVLTLSPDSDVFMLLLLYACNNSMTLYLDTGSGDSRRMIDISSLVEDLGHDYCKSLLGIYVFTGEDTKGQGKIRPLKKLQENPEYL